MRFTVKLFIGYAAFSLLTLALSTALFFTFKNYQSTSHMIFLLDQQRSDEQSLQIALLLELQAVEDQLEHPNPRALARAVENSRRSSELLGRILQAEKELARGLEDYPGTQKRLQSMTKLQEELSSYERSFVDIHNILHAPPPVDRPRAFGIAGAIESGITSRIAEMERSRGGAVAEVGELVLSQRNRALALMAILVVGSLASSLVFTVIVAVSVRRSIRKLAQGTRKVAVGDYDHPIPLGADAELNELYGQFNQMAEQLKFLEEMRLDFVSMLSHDLKSPLAVIKMYADLLADKGAGGREVAAISRSADRLLRLVENFLDFTRADSGRLVPTLGPLALAPLLERVREDGAILAQRYGVTVLAECVVGLPPALGDEALIERAVHNLVSNGVKFNRPGGLVTLRASRRGDRLRIEVTDTGAGINEADRKRLFEKYFRAERTQHVRGTGLGLAATREIVRAHGGELEVESREGEGSTFAFELPIAPQQHAT
jgi:signal transduction histidine kinase